MFFDYVKEVFRVFSEVMAESLESSRKEDEKARMRRKLELEKEQAEQKKRAESQLLVEKLKMKQRLEQTDGAKLRKLFSEAVKSSSAGFCNVSEFSIKLQFNFNHWKVRLPVDSSVNPNRRRLRDSLSTAISNINCDFENKFRERVDADFNVTAERQWKIQQGLTLTNPYEDFLMGYKTFFWNWAYGLYDVRIIAFELCENDVEIIFDVDYDSVNYYDPKNYTKLVYRN